MRLNRTGRLIATLAVALGVTVAAGCGGGINSSSPGGSSSSVKQTVTVAIPGDITNYNPYTDTLIAYGYSIQYTVFDGLVKYSPTLGTEPDLATSWSSNASGTVWTFNLRHGVKFTDGEPFNAQAAIKSFHAVLAAKSLWDVPLQNATSFAAPNPYKLVITLSKPYAPFLDGLAKIAMVAPNKLGEVAKTPVGTGPFKFVSWTPNSQIVLTRNDDYFGAKPAYKTLILKPITDSTTALTDLAAGNVDIVATLPPTAVAQVTKSVAHVVQPHTSNSLELVEFNSSNPATSNPLVRRALSYALDKNAINKIAYNGLATPTWTPVPPTSFAYKAETGYNYNLTKAKQLLAQAKDPHPTLTFIIPSGYPDGVQLGRVWQSSLAQIGVKLNVDVMPLSAWLTKWLAVDYEISWNTFPETSDPGSFYTVIMSAHQKDFKDAQFYSEMAAGVSTTVQSQRKAIYGELQDQLVSEDPAMIVMREPELSVASNKVSGYVMNSLGFGLFAGVKVAK